jgi:signal transduction histidine kinase
MSLPPSIFELLFNQSASAECLLSPAEDPVVVAISDALLRDWKGARTEIIGQRFFQAMPGGSIGDGDLAIEALRRSLALVIATGKPHSIPYRTYSVTAKHDRPGQERVLHAVSTPIVDGKGDLVGLAHRIDDLTTAARLDRALHESRREVETERSRLQAILDTIPTGLVAVDEHGQTTLENAEWKRTWAGSPSSAGNQDDNSYKGYRPKTREPISASEWPCAVSLTHGIATSGVVLDIERFDGTCGTIVVSSAPLRDETGRVVGAVAANMDISELRAAQAQLEDAYERKSDFLSMLSHELRNPLAPIRNSLRILDQVEPSSSQAQRAKVVINRQVSHLTEIVNGLLDVTRIARGKIELHHTQVDLGNLARRTAQDHQELAQQRGLQLDVNVPREPVWILGDETRLAQAIGNLLSNASKFTPTGGQLTVTVSRHADHAFVSVQDSGVGIEPDLLDRIFEPFTQAKQALDRSEGGLGLGLAIVKGIVELHHGSIEVTSTLDAGSEFTFMLPLAQVDSVPKAAISSKFHGQTAGGHLVLVVDDNKDAADSLAELVRLFGHEVHVAYDGPSAVELARACLPELVLCDIGLPGMDGYQVAKVLLAELHDKPMLVAVTGYSQPDDVARCLAAGFDAHVPKPADPNRIEQLIAAPN